MCCFWSSKVIYLQEFYVNGALIFLYLFCRLPNRKIYPHYYDIIEQPISLIRAKLKANKYKSLENLYKDLELLFENAERFNLDKSRIHKDAWNLQSVMRAKFRELNLKVGNWSSIFKSKSN